MKVTTEVVPAYTTTCPVEEASSYPIAGSSTYEASSPVPTSTAEYTVASPTTTFYYSSSCPESSPDVTVTRSAVSTPCPTCPIYTVVYSSGVPTPGVPSGTGAAAGTGAPGYTSAPAPSTSPIAKGAGNKVAASGAVVGLVAFVALML